MALDPTLAPGVLVLHSLHRGAAAEQGHSAVGRMDSWVELLNVKIVFMPLFHQRIVYVRTQFW